MAKITIDGKDYDTENLDQQVKGQIGMLRAADAEIQRLNLQLTLAQTARNSIATMLKGALESAKK